MLVIASSLFWAGVFGSIDGGLQSSLYCAGLSEITPECEKMVDSAR